jgi:hypothetical protein
MFITCPGMSLQPALISHRLKCEARNLERKNEEKKKKTGKGSNHTIKAKVARNVFN